MDWLSRLFEMMPVRGRLDLRCSYGAPWRIEQGPSEANEIPYHAVLAGSIRREAGRCHWRPATFCCCRATPGTSCTTAAGLRR
ncbi:hypothetical protein ACVMGC_004939 [Bradyrhizobium barranii subsp. barranii]